MGAFGAKPANMPVRFTAARAAIDDVEVIHGLVSTLDDFSFGWGYRFSRFFARLVNE
ncbi:hypothetical protein GCM10009096_13820 [Parasphingorhabdus litoris]|uniref:Uncharacterized protein n=1 Tax=Parasphingorhabdus litoris TaxID=394733 RepID=A0ABN1ADD0_9SPHN